MKKTVYGFRTALTPRLLGNFSNILVQPQPAMCSAVFMSVAIGAMLIWC